MIDPVLELSVYDDIPHLLTPVVTEPKKAVVALKWTVREMGAAIQTWRNSASEISTDTTSASERCRQKGEELTRTVQTGFDAETGKPIMEEQPLDLSPRSHTSSSSSTKWRT